MKRISIEERSYIEENLVLNRTIRKQAGETLKIEICLCWQLRTYAHNGNYFIA
jgi:hypothetical protein